jgi:hypothetical protein
VVDVDSLVVVEEYENLKDTKNYENEKKKYIAYDDH